MKSKLFEVRDSGTFLPILAVKLEPGNEADRYLLARTGYGRLSEQQAEYIMIWRLSGGGPSPATTDLYEHGGSRTMAEAHNYINKNFDRLESGAVIDVEFIKGEAPTCKASERLDDRYGGI